MSIHLSDGLDSVVQKVPVALRIRVHQHYISANGLIVFGRRFSVFLLVGSNRLPAALDFATERVRLKE